MKKSLAILASVACLAAGISMAIPDGGGTNDIECATVVFSIPVPAESTTYTWSAYDSDPISDDLLEEDDWEPIPGHTKGKEGDVLDQSVKLCCIDGEVTGGEGSSGEGSAEVFIVVRFNNGGGKVTTKVQQVTCPD